MRIVKVCGVSENGHDLTDDKIEEIIDWSNKRAQGTHFEYFKAPRLYPTVDKVIFNGPATIVYWNDGTKTVVKCMDGDSYDMEKGLMAAICKKFLGDQFHKEIRECLTIAERYCTPDLEVDSWGQRLEKLIHDAKEYCKMHCEGKSR